MSEGHSYRDKQKLLKKILVIPELLGVIILALTWGRLSQYPTYVVVIYFMTGFAVIGFHILEVFKKGPFKITESSEPSGNSQ